MGGKPRQPMYPVLLTPSLPSGTKLNMSQQRLLVGAITHFMVTAQRRKWDTRSGAYLQCSLASRMFMAEVERLNKLPCEIACWGTENWGNYPYPPNDCWGHNAVRIGDVVVDWTARQFDVNAPCPAVWLDDQSVFTEHVVISVAQLEFHSGGNTLWIHDNQGRCVLRIKTKGRISASRRDAICASIEVMADTMHAVLPKGSR